MVLGMRTTYPYGISITSFAANKTAIWLIKKLFGTAIPDVFTGIRIFNKDLLCINSSGFVIETDLSVQAITQGLRMASVPRQSRPNLWEKDRPQRFH